MIQPVAPRPAAFSEVTPAEVEIAFRRGIREAVVRSAKLGFPAVGYENDKITHWSPERVLATFGAEAAPPSISENM